MTTTERPTAATPPPARIDRNAGPERPEAVVAIALGLLMNQQTVTHDDACRRLRTLASSSGRPVPDVAREIVADHHRRVAAETGRREQRAARAAALPPAADVRDEHGPGNVFRAWVSDPEQNPFQLTHAVDDGHTVALCGVRTAVQGGPWPSGSMAWNSPVARCRICSGLVGLERNRY